jgi:hypothetical protein
LTQIKIWIFYFLSSLDHLKSIAPKEMPICMCQGKVVYHRYSEYLPIFQLNWNIHIHFLVNIFLTCYFVTSRMKLCRKPSQDSFFSVNCLVTRILFSPAFSCERSNFLTFRYQIKIKFSVFTLNGGLFYAIWMIYSEYARRKIRQLLAPT